MPGGRRLTATSLDDAVGATNGEGGQTRAEEAASFGTSPFVKPAAVDYRRPGSLAEAVERLAASGPEARVVAGGQSLLAMMNLRIAAPTLLIDIARLPELAERLKKLENGK